VRTRLPVKVKLAVVSAALTFVILCLFAVVIGAVAEQRIRAGFDDDLRATVADLVNRLDPRIGIGGPVVSPAPLEGAQAGGAQVRLLRQDGSVKYPSGLPPLADAGAEGLADSAGYRVVSRALVLPQGQSEFFDQLGEPVSPPVGWVQFGRRKATVQRTVNRVRLFLAFGVLGGTLLAFLGGIWVARRAMRPIAGLTRAAREVARTRDPDIALPAPRANDEVADLAHTFEDMLRELSEAHDESEAALARQREFVADASHELRTPLTSILANLELLEAELQGEQQEMAASALRSSRRMRRLVADLLLLARADAGREATMAPVDLAAIAREAAAEAGALSADHPISLDAPDRVTVTGVADDLHRLAGNLVENALIHTPSGTPVTVSVRRDGSSAVLEVADRGPGVPPQMRERVFERFARAGGDGTRRGSGLGLAIVRAVVDAHGGRVELLDAEGGGARFVVTLPAASGPPPELAGAPRRRALRSRR
jgi:two-component system, OmpR family, sensor kinase